MKRLALAGFLGALLSAGCGDGRGPTVHVEGRVTLDGQPVPNAAIWFTQPRSGAGFNANLDADGYYAVDVLDVKLGETYTVHISGRQPEEGEPVKLDGVGDPEIALPGVPPKYFEATTSGLSANIGDAGDQTFNFDLKPRK